MTRPIEIEISPFCADLRTKKSILAARPPRDEAELLDASRHCWCGRTVEAVGPDARVPVFYQDDGQGIIESGDILIAALRMAEPLRRECMAFLEAVRSRKAPVADGPSGLHVVRALEAGSASLAQGGARIELAAGS